MKLHWIEKSLRSKFNVIEFVALVNTDNNFEELKKQLLKSKLDFYTPNDRYVIEDNDTHFFMPGCSYSLSWYNLIQTFLDTDIPLSSMIVLYNGYGLLEKIMPLIPSNLQKQSCFPRIIDRKSDCWITVGGNHDDMFIEDFAKNKTITNNITKHAITMMGTKRIHRNIIYNHINDKKLFNKIATAYDNVS